MHETGPFTIRDLIFNRNQDPEHNAIESPGCQPLTYRELRIQVLSVVQTLNAMGYHRNDRIGVITPAGPETAVAIISVMCGFSAVPLNPQYKEQEYRNYFLAVSRSKPLSYRKILLSMPSGRHIQ